MDIRTPETNDTSYASQKLTRVAENLYRNGDGTYYGHVVAGGRNHKQSFKTHDRKLANRKLADFLAKIEKKEELAADTLFAGLADEWLASIKPRLKDKSHTRCVSSINQLKPSFKGKRSLIGSPLKINLR